MALTTTTLKRLFTFSGNKCAFPDCEVHIIDNNNTVLGEIAHICARSSKGPRYNKSLSMKERDHPDNLILLCPTHHTLIDKSPELYTVELLKSYKKNHEKQLFELSKTEKLQQSLFVTYYTGTSTKTVIQNAHTVNITGGQKVQFMPPDGTIGSNIFELNYVTYLIKRYHEWASKDRTRKSFSYPVIYRNLTSKFGGTSYKLIPVEKFNELVAYLQNRIDKTTFGKINKSKRGKNYSNIEEYKIKHGY